jgi:hypothetical protein
MTTAHKHTGFIKCVVQVSLVFVLTFFSGQTPEFKHAQRHGHITETRFAFSSSTKRTVAYRVGCEHWGFYQEPGKVRETYAVQLFDYENKTKTRFHAVDHERDQITAYWILLPVIYSVEPPEHFFPIS